MGTGAPDEDLAVQSAGDGALPEAFTAANLPVNAVVTAKQVRPVDSTHGEEYLGDQLYLGISAELQQQLGLEKVSQHVACVLRDTRSDLVDLLALSPRLPDENHAHGDGKGFITKAKDGHYAESNGIADDEAARCIVDANPLDAFGVSTSSFNPDQAGERIQFGVLDKQQVEGKEISTSLTAKPITGGYRSSLLSTWEKKNTRKKPMLIVPNAVANLLGLTMSRVTSSPSAQGNTVADGNVCTVEFPDGSHREVFVAGALDSIGFDDASFAMQHGTEYKVTITAGKRALKIEELGD